MSAAGLGSVMAIMTAAMFARSAFGFGHGAFAMPLLLLVLDVKTATPLLASVSFLVSLAILAGDAKSIRLGSTLTLTLGALAGIPIGVALLVHVDERPVLIGLGLVLGAMSIRGLFGLRLPRLPDDRSAPLVGLVSGVLGGAFNLIGIPVALYGSMRGWSPAEFRASLTGFFFVTGLFSLAGYAFGGLIDGDVGRLLAWCLAPAFLGHLVGTRANRAMSPRVFERWIWGLILLSSVILVVKRW